MKKRMILAVVAAMSLSVAGTALANNPFSDVPQGHWAYDAISQLEKDGLITGYGDGTYRGDRAMSRYEMATVVAQLDDANSENAELISKLRSEFATELYNLGVRVDKLEKNASTIKFTGDARIRYQHGGGSSSLMATDASARTGSRFQERVRINMTANVNEKVKFLGRMKFENTSNRKDSANIDPARSWSQDVWLDRAEILYTNGSFNARLGRVLPHLGQGIIWSDGYPGDGALIGYNSKYVDIFAGVLDLSPTTNSSHGDSSNTSSKNVTVANLSFKLTDAVTITAAHLNSHDKDLYCFKQVGFGANAKLGKDWKLMGEWIKNSADIPVGAKNRDQDKGYWLRLQYKNANMSKPGTYSIYAEYLSMGAYAVDSSAHGDMLDISPGNGTGKDGAKGYGLGITYVTAKNMSLQFAFHDLDTKDGTASYKNSYQFITNFRF